ncbi:DUF4376 domain-containing protein [Marinomonas rhizomae]|uniref:DUF4376 domain-containing protein n=1 Tax=Marinomonas rhizomae TaxID=491948 RepID=UPI002105C45F|nr:DUF4376 domain-containing protein [Marinomonas rhizomae]UTW01237.1 DUF4376 domain-containing protein [Marinomonas rhizomae]
MIKHVIYTQIDSKTGVPATQSPMRNGPAMPVGIDYAYALESQYPTSEPIFYGTTDRDDLPDWIEVITQEQFDADKAAEMQARHEKLLKQSEDQAASVRYRIETGGIALSNGANIMTATDDQNRISSAYSSLQNNLVTEIDFKGADGWSKMTINELEPIARAVVEHVSIYCFGAERDVCEQLAEMDYAALQTADIEQRFNDAYDARKLAHEQL